MELFPQTEASYVATNGKTSKVSFMIFEILFIKSVLVAYKTLEVFLNG